MTPLICKLLLGAIVPVDAIGVAISTIQVQKPVHSACTHSRTPCMHIMSFRVPILQVVLVPIVVGMLANAKFPKTVKKIEPFSPIVRVQVFVSCALRTRALRSISLVCDIGLLNIWSLQARQGRRGNLF